MVLIAQSNQLKTAALAGRHIDFSKRFMPERLTPLFHTACYERLNDAQKLRYNQLHASYLNEQTIFFESVMAQPILHSLRRAQLPCGLAEDVRQFMVEEMSHSQMFRELNRQCRPGIYSRTDFHFVHVPPALRFSLNIWVRQSRWFPFFLWILLIQEERALFYAREFLNEANQLESGFVVAQRRHLADEAGHIHWDEQLLDWIWPRTGRFWRGVNARLFGWMMGEFFTTPKRSGLRVVAELTQEFPGLKPLWLQLRAAMLQLSRQPDFNALCYSRRITPKAFSRFDRWPEFRWLGKVLPEYHPPSGNSK